MTTQAQAADIARQNRLDELERLRSTTLRRQWKTRDQLTADEKLAIQLQEEEWDAFKHRKDYQEIRQRIQTDKSFAKDLYTENSKAAQVARQSKQEVDADEELARKLYEEHMNEINSHKSKSQSDLLADEELARKLAELDSGSSSKHDTAADEELARQLHEKDKHEADKAKTAAAEADEALAKQLHERESAKVKSKAQAVESDEALAKEIYEREAAKIKAAKAKAVQDNEQAARDIQNAGTAKPVAKGKTPAAAPTPAPLNRSQSNIDADIAMARELQKVLLSPPGYTRTDQEVAEDEALAKKIESAFLQNSITSDADITALMQAVTERLQNRILNERATAAK